MAWWFVRRVSTYAIPTQSCPRRRLARTASSPATTEVHHSPDWTPHGATDADKLFFACGPDHKRVTDGHYHQPHRHRPPGLDRRHHTTRHQPRPPPRRNTSTATPTHPTTTRSERTQ